MYSDFIKFAASHQNEDVSVQVIPEPRIDGLRVRMRKGTRFLERIFSFEELLVQSSEAIILDSMYAKLTEEDN